MDMRNNMRSSSVRTWGRLCMVAAILVLFLAHHTECAPAKESDSTRLTNALLRLDDALDELSAYFRDTKRDKVDNTKAVDNAEEEDIEPPKPEIPEKEERNEDAEIMENQDGSRPEITAELEDITEKELAEVPDGQAQAVDEEEDEERQEAVLRAALRYLLKVQKQERRQKKDYDIPFPIFGSKRSQNNE